MGSVGSSGIAAGTLTTGRLDQVMSLLYWGG